MTDTTNNFVFFAFFVFVVVVTFAGSVVISRFAGSIKNMQADTEVQWDRADKMELARVQREKDVAAGGR